MASTPRLLWCCWGGGCCACCLPDSRSVQAEFAHVQQPCSLLALTYLHSEVCYLRCALWQCCLQPLLSICCLQFAGSAGRATFGDGNCLGQLCTGQLYPRCVARLTRCAGTGTGCSSQQDRFVTWHFFFLASSGQRMHAGFRSLYIAVAAVVVCCCSSCGGYILAHIWSKHTRGVSPMKRKHSTAVLQL